MTATRSNRAANSNSHHSKGASSSSSVGPGVQPIKRRLMMPNNRQHPTSLGVVFARAGKYSNGSIIGTITTTSHRPLTKRAADVFASQAQYNSMDNNNIDHNYKQKLALGLTAMTESPLPPLLPPPTSSSSSSLPKKSNYHNANKIMYLCTILITILSIIFLFANCNLVSTQYQTQSPNTINYNNRYNNIYNNYNNIRSNWAASPHSMGDISNINNKNDLHRSGLIFSDTNSNRDQLITRNQPITTSHDNLPSRFISPTQQLTRSIAATPTHTNNNGIIYSRPILTAPVVEPPNNNPTRSHVSTLASQSTSHNSKSASSKFWNFYDPISPHTRTYSAEPALVKPVHFRSVTVAPMPSANTRWSASDAVNFSAHGMTHLYLLTDMVLDFLLQDDLIHDLINQTLFENPIPVLVDNRASLMAHFHKVLLAICLCLCVAISIPLFGFLIACCWCSGGNSSSSPKVRPRSNPHSTRAKYSGHHSRSHGRSSNQNEWPMSSVPGSAGGSRAGRHRNHDRGYRSSSGDYQRRTTRGHHHHHRTRSEPNIKYESPCHPCLRTIISSNMFVNLLLIAFFAVCAFVTNEYVYNGVGQLPRTMNQTLDDLQVYLNNTDFEVDNLFKANYVQLERELGSRLDTSGAIVQQKLAIVSEATALSNLTDLVIELNDTKVHLQHLDKELNTLERLLDYTKNHLKTFKDIITKNCPDLTSCPILHNSYPYLNDSFRIYPHYENLPNLTMLITKISALLDSDIITQVKAGKHGFDQIGNNIQREVNQTLPEIKVQLKLVGRQLSQTAADISNSIKWSDNFFKQTRIKTKDISQYAQYEQYRRYACLGGAAVILFVLFCYSIGWLYGSCRPQPTYRSYKTRAKTAASSSFPFSCGIVTMFLLFLPLMLAALALFMVGSVGDKIICQVMQHPERTESKAVIAMLQNKVLGTNISLWGTEKYPSSNHKVYKPNLADIVGRCHQNLSLYKVLKLDVYEQIQLSENNGHPVTVGLDRTLNLTATANFKKMNDIESRLKSLLKYIETDSIGVLSRIQLLPPSAEELLRKSRSLSFDEVEASFTRLYESGQQISPINFDTLSKELREEGERANRAELHFASLAAESLKDNFMPNITVSLTNLKDGIRHLKIRMFHGRSNFGLLIEDLIAKVRSAELQIRKNGKQLIADAAQDYINELNALLDQYANHMRDQIENVIGQCEPVSRALNYTTSAFCEDVVLPFNGFWFSIVSSLLLLLPATFMAYALRSLYQRPKPPSFAGGSYHHHHHPRSSDYDDASYDDDGEEVALAYLDSQPKATTSSMPSAPVVDDGWSPTAPSQHYVHNTRPPPYVL